MPESPRAIAVFVSIKTVIALAAIWLLLRANGERIAGLGLRRESPRRARCSGDPSSPSGCSSP